VFHGHGILPGQQFKQSDDHFEKIALGEIDRLSELADLDLFLC
jgi:hypothetical protein